MGAKIKIKDGYIFAKAKNGLKGAKIKFPLFQLEQQKMPCLPRLKQKEKLF